MPETAPHPPDDDLLRAMRRRKLQQLLDLGVDPWGSRFDDRQPIGDIRRRAGEIRLVTEDGQSLELPPVDDAERERFQSWLAPWKGGQLRGPTVRAAGRVVLHRDKGKLHFIDLDDWTGRIQLFVGRSQIGEENWRLVECLDLGDLIGVDGELRRTRTGELSIFAAKLHFLGKALEPPPAKHVGMTDAELRQRLRYADLAYNEGVRDRFLDRSRIVQSVRQTLAAHGFCEVEGPTLHTLAGGAAARPFSTHHNALDLDLFLRIALELHLKRLMVGGIERVYELGRVYRNEGISHKHNPEFTMLEVYQAYGDYRSMMDLTEAIIAGAFQSLGRPPRVAWGDAAIDFATPFARRRYDDLLAEHTGVDPTCSAEVQAEATRRGLAIAGKHADVVKSDLFEAAVEPRLSGPLFVIDYPASICPLTKRQRGNPAVAERFELFVQGMELANAYTELNDPDLQTELFQTQLDGLPPEESMARMDHDFIRALRYGMPPAGGLGLGIDRLVMLLTGCASIRDVILFPLMRPESPPATA